jgi:hypothetical protein
MRVRAHAQRDLLAVRDIDPDRGADRLPVLESAAKAIATTAALLNNQAAVLGGSLEKGEPVTPELRVVERARLRRGLR